MKWGNPGKGVVSPLQLGVVATQKGAIGSPSTKVASFAFAFTTESQDCWYIKNELRLEWGKTMTEQLNTPVSEYSVLLGWFGFFV